MRPIIQTNITQQTIWQSLTLNPLPTNIAATPIANAVLDNRDCGPGDLFVALAGPHDDGHNYIGDALQRGAEAILCQSHGVAQAQNNGATILDLRSTIHDSDRENSAIVNQKSKIKNPYAYIVDDTTAALQKIAKYHRLYNCDPALKVIGITGSVGKSSTKELVAVVLNQRGETLHNPGNLNSEQGLPFTLLNLGPQHCYAVLEMGMYARGELETLCDLAQPQVGIVTNVGISHLSRLGTVENIALAKAELVQSLPPAEDGGVAILNWDDKRVRAMAQQTAARVMSYGLTPDAELWADSIESAGYSGIRFDLHHRDPVSGVVTDIEDIALPLLGRHHAYTALCAAAAGITYGLSWADIRAALESPQHELRLVLVPGLNGTTLIDDTYNSSPVSGQAALDLLADLQPDGNGRRIALLGDMLELGQQSEAGHHRVGQYAANVADLLFTVGELGQQIGQAALQTGYPAQQVQMFPDDRAAIISLQALFQPNDLLLIKGSRAIGMDKIVEALRQPPATSNQQPITNNQPENG